VTEDIFMWSVRCPAPNFNCAFEIILLTYLLAYIELSKIADKMSSHYKKCFYIVRLSFFKKVKNHGQKL